MWLCLIILILVNIAAVGYAVNRNRNLHDDLIASCERGNDIRVTLNVVISSQFPDLPKLPQVDCREAVR